MHKLPAFLLILLLLGESYVPSFPLFIEMYWALHENFSILSFLSTSSVPKMDLPSFLKRSEAVSATLIEPPLSQAVGYVVVVIIGLLIASGMLYQSRSYSIPINWYLKWWFLSLEYSRRLSTRITPKPRCFWQPTARFGRDWRHLL